MSSIVETNDGGDLRLYVENWILTCRYGQKARQCVHKLPV